ncbi:ABC transporter permease [Natrarchaeobaculum sulfurireducens]|uniref:ABC-type transport system involved in multi-copper enzyme maturation, permease component n=1 Tax=Natrarchaeobaculum sulfurireducens TaxID=2044521 RepID=A0A346PJ00_9EURY|nr:ABC transporter permease [Natrarchaeobaculum sulfurireducens]AXR79495.1 ABC-type transport system involved in multi-copper enzyme maturation, permease component [Natrarchaeobaculum sulfurireducens]AXR83262.1 Nitrous oxide reductase maturation transmembrane protein NosY [Natrarchaeobaculum sulfurireducens]
MSPETDTGTDAVSAEPASPSSSINPDSVRAIAKKDFQDAVRSWLFWGLSVFFFTLLVTITGVVSYFGEDIAQAGATTEALVVFVSEITRLVIPLIALILGWKAIAGERERGSIKILLSLPHSRKDVLLGKLIGRSAVLSISLIVGFVLAAVVVAAMLGAFDVADYVGLLAMSILYGVAYTSIAVALSSLTRSTTVAGAAMVGVFVLFYIVWNAINTTFQLLMNQGYIAGETYTIDTDDGPMEFERLPDWAYFVESIDPGYAYNNALSIVTSAAETELGVAIEDAMFDGSVPFYLQDWFSFVVLLFWIVVPIAVALYRFDRVDL